ncbi:MAG: prefoldin subunit [Nanoarchaeota archaeon]|nr:prefoldin subunit [Nanoarchaeota archaeon]
MVDENKIQEMQFLEQSLQNILLQKQAFQMELSETQSAFKEIKGAGEEVFKIVGQLMIKTDKKRVEEELENKQKLLDLRLKSLEKQEASTTEQLEKIRDQVLKQHKKK